MSRRLALGLWSACVLVAACGGDNGSDPDDEPAFPAAAGTYNVSGGFDGLTPAEANFTGTVTVTQASRDAAPLGGTAAITATVGGDVFPINGALSDASITTAGVMTFVLDGGGADWTFTGNLNGSTVSGRHTLSDGVDAFSGNWSMTRAATVRAPAARASTTLQPSDLHRALLAR